jgi:hypothetical protein
MAKMQKIELCEVGCGDYRAKLPNGWTARVYHRAVRIELRSKSGLVTAEVRPYPELYTKFYTARRGLNRLLKRLGWNYEVTL